jgi:hypothetical protein
MSSLAVAIGETLLETMIDRRGGRDGLLKWHLAGIAWAGQPGEVRGGCKVTKPRFSATTRKLSVLQAPVTFESSKMPVSGKAMSALTISDFEKQPRGAYRFDRWAAQRQIPTPFGPFGILLYTLGDSDSNPPDDAMVARASGLIQFIEAHAEEVLDVVYGQYLLTAEAPDWLESRSVPRNLSRSQVPAYVDDRLLVVSRHIKSKEQCSSVVFIDPRWEPEHKLRLDIRDGLIATANDSKFTLESEVLRWVSG